MSEPYRILVTGSRDWMDIGAIWSQLKEACDTYGTDRVIIVHGGARGADTIAAEYAALWGIKTEVHPARWRDFGRAAGPRRNAWMVSRGASVCLAFIKDGSRGAAHCAALAEKAGIPVRRFTST